MGEMGVKTSKGALRNLAAAAKIKAGGADALPARERRRSRSSDAPSSREGRSLTREDRGGDDEFEDMHWENPEAALSPLRGRQH